MAAVLVEGDVDEAVARRLLGQQGLGVSVVYGKQGFGFIRKTLGKYNQMARSVGIFALTDAMDMHESCPPETLRALLPSPFPGMCFRLAQREVESWIMADRANFSSFIGVPISRLTHNPDELRDPKAEIVRLANRSRKRQIRTLMVPEPRSGGAVGRGYNGEIQRFVANHWAPEAASKFSPSLKRCISAIKVWASTRGQVWR